MKSLTNWIGKQKKFLSAIPQLFTIDGHLQGNSITPAYLLKNDIYSIINKII
jgi:hypothetical protein